MAKKQMTLGEKLRELRESFDLSQNQVARALNIDRSTYTNYELDKTRPNLETLVKLAHIYSVPPVYLLPGEIADPSAFKDSPRPDSMLQSLTKEERGLIVFYRTLDPEDRALMREEIAKIAKKKR